MSKSKTDQTSVWTGEYIRGALPAAIVKYHGPTSHRPPKWIATLTRGEGLIVRLAVPFSDGPLVAALAAAAKSGSPHWAVVSVHHIDNSTYSVAFNTP